MLEFAKSGQVFCGRNSKRTYFYQVMVVFGLGFVQGVFFCSSSAQAAICFLPDCADKILEFQGGDDETAKACRESGYELYSNLVCSEYSKIEYCPSNPNYIKCNDRKWCIENGYNVPPDTCNIPKYPDEKCPNNQPLYKSCVIDYERACNEEDEDYVSECEEGWKLDPSNLCSYSTQYGKCCNMCSDYPYEEDDIPRGYQKAGSCLACGNIIKYKTELNDCAGKGFIRCDHGGQIGTEVCWRGDEKWYKECCGYECDLESCPKGTECRLEGCSNLYCIIGCSVNYTDYCVRPIEDCSLLGYTSTACGGEKLICPYDTAKFFCIQI